MMIIVTLIEWVYLISIGLFGDDIYDPHDIMIIEREARLNQIPDGPVLTPTELMSSRFDSSSRNNIEEINPPTPDMFQDFENKNPKKSSLFEKKINN